MRLRAGASAVTRNRSRRRATRFSKVAAAATGAPAFAALLLAFALALVLFGGSSRYDELAQAPLRLVAILVIAAAGLRRVEAPSTLRLPALLLAATVALISIQLIPLPPQLWTALPGRSAFAEAAAAAGFDQPWRPFAIAPDLALNSLFSLTVPVATLYGLAVLDQRYRYWVLPILLLIVLCSMLVGISQLVTGSERLTGIYELTREGTAPGIFANRNHQALLLAAGLPLIAGWDLLRRGESVGAAARWGAAATAALLLIVLVSTGSRAGLMLGGFGLIGGMAVVWSWRVRADGKKGRSRWILVGMGVSVALLLAMAIFFERAQAIDRLLASDPLADKRARALPTLLEMIGSYFPLGSGFGTFDPAFRHVEPFELLEATYFNQAHNDLLQLMIEGGVPALLLLVAGLGWLGIAGVRLWRSRSTRSVVVRGRAASLILVMMLAASAVDYPLRTPIMMAFACAMIFEIAVALDGMRQSGTDKSLGTSPEARFT